MPRKTNLDKRDERHDSLIFDKTAGLKLLPEQLVVHRLAVFVIHFSQDVDGAILPCRILAGDKDTSRSRLARVVSNGLSLALLLGHGGFSGSHVRQNTTHVLELSQDALVAWTLDLWPESALYGRGFLQDITPDEFGVMRNERLRHQSARSQEVEDEVGVHTVTAVFRQSDFSVPVSSALVLVVAVLQGVLVDGALKRTG